KKKKNKRIIYASIVILIILVLLLFFKCCRHRAVPRLKDGSKPSIALLETNILNQNKEELHFAIRFVIFRDSKHSEDQIRKKDLYIDSIKRPKIFFKQNTFDKKTEKQKEPFSTILLIDQSGSMTSNDRDKKRFEAVNMFNKNFGYD